MPPTNGVEIKLGGAVRKLRYTAPILERVEMILEEPIGQTLVHFERVSFRRISVLLWAALQHEGGKAEGEEDYPDLETVRGWIEPPIRDTALKIEEALQPWLPAPEQAKKGGT